MPCITHPTEYKREPSPQDARAEARKQKEIERLNKYEAAFCALFNEVSMLANADEIIQNACQGGLIEIRALVAEHNWKDMQRLTAEMKKYSDHEKRMIAEILKNQLK